MLGFPRECMDIASCFTVLTTGKRSSLPMCWYYVVVIPFIFENFPTYSLVLSLHILIMAVDEKFNWMFGKEDHLSLPEIKSKLEALRRIRAINKRKITIYLNKLQDLEQSRILTFYLQETSKRK